MSPDEKKYYLDVFLKLEPLLDMIADRSGCSWWSPPGEDWHFTCDMGDVYEFLEQLEAWLRGEEVPESTSRLYKNDNVLR